jgi:DNA-binding SARP family transcriptional activator
MRYVLLGPVAVIGPDGPRALAGPKQRSLLAALLLRANQVVSDDQLCGLVWGTDWPTNARAQLQVYMSGLRKVVGRGTISRNPPGYQIHVEPGELDLQVVRAALARAAAGLAAGRTEPAARELRDALSRWPGPALGGAAEPLVHREGAALEELRLTAYEQFAGAELELGRAEGLVGELGRLVQEHPFRERLALHLMRALHDAGRTPEALAAYTAIRARMTGELGIDPSPRLRELHQSILRGNDPAGPAPEDGGTPKWLAPAQLPPAPAVLVGRDRELADLCAAAEQWAVQDDPPVRLLVLHGLPGVGKTALATSWAHDVRHLFPDGQLHVDLHGFDTHRPALPVAEAQAQLLRALGAAADRLPESVAERSRLLRSLLAGRRVLLLLDGAASAEQVRPLLPGHRAVVVVTSRYRLDDLVVHDGAAGIPVDPLPVAETVTLLRAELGDPPVDADPEAAADLAGICGGLPLAARIAAANIAARGGGPLRPAVADLLGDGVLEALSLDGAPDNSVSAAAAASYTRLPPEQRRLFRRLGLLALPEFTRAAAEAADSGDDPAATRRRLRALVAANLLHPAGHEHYRMHELLYRYARSLPAIVPAARSHPRVPGGGHDLERQPQHGGRP